MLEEDLATIRRRRGIKWSRHGPEVLAAWVADMDFGAPPSVVEELGRTVADGDLGYCFEDHDALPALFVERMAERHGWTVDPERVVLFDDVLQPLEAALWWGTDPGAGVMIQTPIYPPFLGAVEGCGRRLVDHPLRLTGQGWRLDLDTLDEAAAQSSAVLVCNPHNPTGRVFSRPELEALAQAAIEHDLLIVSDEIHAELIHPGHRHLPLASLGAEVAARTLTLTSASKTHNLAGLRCAVGVLDAEVLRSRLTELPPHLLGNVNSLGARATRAAWTPAGDAWAAEALATIVANTARLAERLGTEVPEVRWYPPEGTYLAWLDVRPYGLGDRPARTLIERAGVALSEGADFGPHGVGWVRLNLATTPAVLEAVIDRLVAGLLAGPA